MAGPLAILRHLCLFPMLELTLGLTLLSFVSLDHPCHPLLGGKKGQLSMRHKGQAGKGQHSGLLPRRVSCKNFDFKLNFWLIFLDLSKCAWRACAHVCDQKIIPLISNFFFALFLRVANVRHFYVFGEIEKCMENTGIPPPNQLKSVTGSQVVGFLICFGLLLLLSSFHQHLM